MRPLDPRLLQHARAARGYVVLTAALGALTAGLVVTQALLLARAVAPVVVGGATFADVRTPVLALLAVVAARAAVAWAQERYGHRAATSVIGELRARVVRHAADLGPAALAGERGPALATLTTRGLDALDGYLVKYLPQLLMAATVTPAVLAVVWWHDTIAGVTVLLTLPLVPLFMALVGLMTRDAADRRLRSMQRLGAQVLDLVAGLPTLRALGRERGQGVRVREVGEAYRRATMRTLGTAFLSALVLESLTTLSVALVAVGIGLRLVYGHLDLQTGLAVLVMAPEAYLPLRMVGVHYHASVDGIAAAAEAFAVLETPAPAPGTRPAPDLAATTVRLRGVTVVHPGRDRATPAALDLDVAPGEVVALAGPSGVGKTTAAAVLLGLRRPDAGQVLLAGPAPDAGPDGVDLGSVDLADVDLADVDPTTWWPQVAWVPQRPLVVPGTIAENVLLGTEPGPERGPDGADDGRSPALPAALLEAADAAGLTEVVAALPDGWRTRVGHGGLGLSAGQRQRLGLARAFVRDAALVVLDEPTAHLDPATEQVVHAAIGRLRDRRRSVVLVAHRPALLALADRVVTVHDGPAAADDGPSGTDDARSGTRTAAASAALAVAR